MKQRDEPLMSVNEVAAALGCSRRSVYNIDWLWNRVVYATPSKPGFEPADVRLYKQLRTGLPRRARCRKVAA